MVFDNPAASRTVHKLFYRPSECPLTHHGDLSLVLCPRKN